MDPISVLGISLAAIIAGESLLIKVYTVVRARRQQREVVSSQVSNTM